MNQNLEEITKETPVRNYVADTVAGISFYTPIALFNEYFIAGLESEEILKTRLMGVGLGLVINRPYGKFRKFCAEKAGVTSESSKLKKLLLDTFTNLAFQTPLYTTMLALSGADLKEIAVALPLGLVMGATTGRPYGWYLDKVRKLFGTQPTLDK